MIRAIQLKMLWGEWLAALAIGLSLVRVATEYPPGHYQMFMEASRALWSGGQAYDVPFLGNLFFFSPACALLFYGPFTLLPEIPGVFLYTALSAGLFIWGAVRFGSHFLDRKNMQWFWLLVASQLYSSLAAHKPEVSNMGITLLAAAWLIEGRRLGGAAFFLAMVGNFKLQPLPAVALLALVVCVLMPKLRKWCFGLTASLGFWFAIPWALRPWVYLEEQHRLWLGSLRQYSAENFDFYDNVYAFLGNNFEIKMSFETSQLISLSFAAACALVLYIWMKRQGQKNDAWESGIFFALILGASYTTLVSPLQQVSAYVLLAPLFLALAWIRGTYPKKWTPIVWVLFLFWSIAYSGLMPESIRGTIRHAVVRVPATVVALIAVIGIWFRAFPRTRARYP
jgi:hypothetical protein